MRIFHFGLTRPAQAVLLSIALALYFASCSSQPRGTEFSGGYLVQNAMTWEEFLDVREQNRQNGFRLVDIETYSDDGVTSYAAVWLETSFDEKVWKADNWLNLDQKLREFRAEGVRFVDVEAVNENGQQKALGLFASGEDKDPFRYHLAWQNLEEQNAKEIERGRRLIDVEAYEESGSIQYAAVWRESKATSYLHKVTSWEAFKDVYAEYQDDAQLIDFEISQGALVTEYIGLWLKGRYESVLWAQDSWEGFLAKKTEMDEQGWYLVDIEVSTDGTGRLRYSGVWHDGENF